MVASKASVAKWKALQASGHSWKSVAAQNKSEVDALRSSLGAAAPRWGHESTLTYSQRKALQTLTNAQPHQAPHGIVKTLKPVGQVIKWGAVAGVGVGLAGAAGSAFGSAAGPSAGGVLGSGQVTAPVLSGGGGLLGSGGGLANIISTGGGIVGDIFGDISSTLGQVGGIWQQGRDLFGGGGSPQGPPAQDPALRSGGMPAWGWLVIVLGAGALVYAIVKRK